MHVFLQVFLVEKAGRRSLFLAGLMGMLISAVEMKPYQEHKSNRHGHSTD